MAMLVYQRVDVFFPDSGLILLFIVLLFRGELYIHEE